MRMPWKEMLSLVVLSGNAPIATAHDEFGTVAILGERCEDFVHVNATTGEGIVLTFSEPVAAEGPGDHVLRRCLVRIPLLLPVGFQFKWLAGTWSGTAEIGSEGRATVTVRTFFPGVRDSEASGRNLTESGEWAVNVGESSEWSPCSEPGDLAMLITASGRSAQARVEIRPGELRLPPLIYKRCVPAE